MTAGATLSGPDARGSLPVLELAIRTAKSRLGAGLLQTVLGADRGHRGPQIDCGAGHRAEFVAYRAKTIDTVLGPISLDRAYYHCGQCRLGFCPRDAELGLTGSSLSPGLRSMVDRVAATAPFATASTLLTELAGVRVDSKRIERAAEADGSILAVHAEHEATAVITGQPSPLGPAEAPAVLYVAMDGTGIPTVPAAVAGRTGMYPDGRARTREAKLAVLFTQTSVDEQGYPIRDQDSSSYLSTFHATDRFGELLYTEAARRGAQHAGEMVVLGDGRPGSGTWPPDTSPAPPTSWTCSTFAAPTLGDNHARWLADRLDDLDDGDIAAITTAVTGLTVPPDIAVELDKALDYFRTNADRMNYLHFRELGYFVGSGTVEAGCKAVLGQRLKQSGMRWSLPGATGIAALRCYQASGRWDEIPAVIHHQANAA